MTDTTTTSPNSDVPATPPAPLYVIGLGLPFSSNGDSPGFSRSIDHPVMASADVLIGGRAQLAAFSNHPAEKLLVGADAAKLYARIENNRNAGRTQVVLCGGDPLFFGLGARLAERFGADSLHILPGVSSLQAAAAFLGMAWEGVESVSLHGRTSRLALAHALIRARSGGGLVFVLADAVNHPAAVAAFMKERGCGRFIMHVLGNLHFVLHEGASRLSALSDYSEPLIPRQSRSGQAFAASVKAEYYARLTLDEALSLPKKPLGPDHPLQLAMLLEPQEADAADPAWPFGVPDELLATEGELLTKGPVRATGLAALGIEPDHIVWDLGAGSGAVSVEVARLAFRGQVIAVEARAGRIALIEENRRRFGAANLEIVPGMMPGVLEQCASLYPRPHRVFFGGGLGGGNDESSREAAEQIFQNAWNALLPGGRIVFHCILLSSLEFVRAQLAKAGAAAEVTCVQVSKSVPLAGDLRLQALNPVFLISARKA